MALSNRDRVDRGFLQLRDGLRAFTERVVGQIAPGADWIAVLNEQGKNFDADDVQTYLFLMTQRFQDFYKPHLPYAARNYANELRDFRNDHAHYKPVSTEDTLRMLDTTGRLLDLAGAPDQAEAVRKLRTDLARRVFEEQTRRDADSDNGSVNAEGKGLRPWREVMPPHDDVATGNFNASEYAADLWLVSRGEGEAEYADPVEFFTRTYLTATMRELLVSAVNRVAGDSNAAPGFNLQTNFGGGKTHTLLALYHIFGGTPLPELPQEVQELLTDTGYPQLGEVRRVVLVGTHISPALGIPKDDGTVVNTLWGELAWQLGGRSAFDRIAEADRTGTSPGHALTEIIRDHSPCVILIDEWVAYARQLVAPAERLSGGSFEDHFTFAQLLTEAVKAVPGALLTVSIPASSHADDDAFSSLEVGGENGVVALKKLQNVVRRLAEPKSPASAHESFEIVRRRLFEQPDGDAVTEIAAVARQFTQFYSQHRGELPGSAAEPAYERRIRECYPIHPELFDRLYEDWSTLERFQRTRGVLRLMSKVIHQLWMSQDSAPLIMPGTVPLDSPVVVSELTQYLEDAWKPVIDADVDGATATPAEIDAEKPFLGKRAISRRLARSIFLGSAATLKTAHKGIDKQGIYLGTAIPGDALGNYPTALNLLSDRATYLYADGERWWFDLQASVTRMARDYADRLLEQPEVVWDEIVRRLNDASQTRNRGELAGVHACPDSTREVPDDPRARLVILHPGRTHTRNAADSEAMRFCIDCLDHRGSGQRSNRNMLVFLAADHRKLADLQDSVRDFLAWSDIVSRIDELNLAPQQATQARTRRSNADDAINLRIAETYTHLLVPTQPDPQQPISWEELRPESSDGTLAQRCSGKLIRSDHLRKVHAAANIRTDLEGPLASVWDRGHISVADLWGFYCRYLYLARLRDRGVLDHGVAGVLELFTYESEGFALADGYDKARERYIGLRIPGGNAGTIQVTDHTLLVDLRLAEEQAARDSRGAPGTGERTPPGPGTGGTGAGTGTGPGPVPPEPDQPKRTRFHGAYPVSPERYGAAFNKLGQEVLAHLQSIPGAELQITVEIQATSAGGFSDEKVRIISENARTLKFTDVGFEDE